MKLAIKVIIFAAAVATVCISGAAWSQLTSSTVFPSNGEEAPRLQDYPSISHRYGHDNQYSRWRATGQWDRPPMYDAIGRSQAPDVAPQPSDKQAPRAARTDGYGEPLKSAGSAPK